MSCSDLRGHLSSTNCDVLQSFYNVLPRQASLVNPLDEHITKADFIRLVSTLDIAQNSRTQSETESNVVPVAVHCE